MVICDFIVKSDKWRATVSGVFLKEGVRIGSTQRNRIEWAQGYRIRPFLSLPGQERNDKTKKKQLCEAKYVRIRAWVENLYQHFYLKINDFLHIWIFERFYLSTKIILFVTLFMACNGMADGILGALNRLRRIENERKIENLVKDDPGLMRIYLCIINVQVENR